MSTFFPSQTGTSAKLTVRPTTTVMVDAATSSTYILPAESASPTGTAPADGPSAGQNVMLHDAAVTDVHDKWLALGVSLRFLTSDEGGRSKALGIVDTEYVKYAYRPNWGLPDMTGTDQVGAPVLWLQHFPVNLGDRVRAVIVPLAPGSLHLWERVHPGDVLRMFEGPRVCGQAVVEWVRPTVRPVPDADADRFIVWAEGGEQPD